MSETNLHYTTLPSPIGDLLAGASPTGICWLGWQDDSAPSTLETVCRKWYPGSSPDDEQHPLLTQLAQELDEYFHQRRQQFTVPLDLHGTEFEQSVWRVLQKIPYGETRSYGQIAAELGKPKAVRAVGRANGANNIPILIPCHRVISAAGKLHGYTGGRWRKERLLALEGVTALVL